MGKVLIESCIMFIALFWQIYMIAIIIDLLFDINSTIKQKLIYVLINVITGVILKLTLPIELAFLNLCVSAIMTFLTIKFIFKLSCMKSFFALILSISISIPIEALAALVAFKILNITSDATSIIESIPMLLFINILFSLTTFMIYLFKRKNSNFTFKDMNRDIIFSLFSTVIFILPNILFYTINKYNYPFYLLVYNIIAYLGFVSIGIYNTYNCIQLQLKKRDLENEQLYNNHLLTLIDSIRVFKHDYNNVVQSIGGYIALKDIDGLSKYYQGLFEDCQSVNNAEFVSPITINEPSIYGLMASKFQVAELKGIKFNLESMFDYSRLRMDIYNFCKILGVLLDNALEAAEETSDKTINISIKENIRRKQQFILIENTYKNKSIDLKLIYEKDYSTKKRNSGIGLWEVKNIIKKYSNVKLTTTKDNKFFKQQLIINYA